MNDDQGHRPTRKMKPRPEQNKEARSEIVRLPKVVENPNETVLASKVPPGRAGATLLQYLSGRFKYQSTEVWKELILDGKVKVNGRRTQPETKLAKWDEVAYSVELHEPAVDPRIRILHEEDSFLVAYKPGQLPSHSDSHYIKNTFIYLITELLRKNGFSGKPMLSHRLDRETSGLMVVAKEKASHLNLSKQFETGQVEKQYLAIVRGVTEQDSYEVSGTIERDPESKISIRKHLVAGGVEGGKDSFTRFEVVERVKDHTLMRCIPKTGRTHQIRVHLASIGYPVAGDKLYGCSDTEYLEYLHFVKTGGDASWDGRMEAKRQMLHASTLAFTHPINDQRIAFENELPEDMKQFMDSHRQK